MPYLPAGVDNLPENRFILFSDANHKVRVIDESTLQKSGFSFTGYRDTPTLNRDNPLAEYSLTEFLIIYEASQDTSIFLRPSGDGCQSFDPGKRLELRATSGSRQRRASTGFNTTGFDLRVRMELDRDSAVVIYGYKAYITERSELLIS